MRILKLIIFFFLIIGCNKTKKNIYELKPDKEYYFLKKENGDSIKIPTESYQFDYSTKKFLKISCFNSNTKKYKTKMILLNVKGEYYNYFNIKNKDSIDQSSYIFLTKHPQIIENKIDSNPINYWKKGTEIFKKESKGVYSRQLFFTGPNNYILDFGKYYFDENYRIFKIEETIGKNKITYK